MNGEVDTIPSSYDNSLSIGCESIKLDKISWQDVSDSVLEGIAHRLGNQLTVLVGVAEIMSRQEDLPPVMQALLNEIPMLESSVDLLRKVTVVDDEMSAIQAYETDRLVRDAVDIVSLRRDFDSEFTLELLDVPPVIGICGRIIRDITALLTHAGKQSHRVSVSYVQNGKQLSLFANDFAIELSCLA